MVMRITCYIDCFDFLVRFWIWQVKDVLFEPVRKTQDAMFFFKNSDNMFIPCGPKQPGAVQITMQELAAQGLASQVCIVFDSDGCCCWWLEYLLWFNILVLPIVTLFTVLWALCIHDDYQVIENLISSLFIRTGTFHSNKY